MRNIHNKQDKKHRAKVNSTYLKLHKCLIELCDKTFEFISKIDDYDPINHIMEINQEIHNRIKALEEFNNVIKDKNNEYVVDEKGYNRILASIKYFLVFIKTLFSEILKGNFKDAFSKAKEVASNIHMIKSSDAFREVLNEIYEDAQAIKKDIDEFCALEGMHKHNVQCISNFTMLRNTLNNTAESIEEMKEFIDKLANAQKIIVTENTEVSEWVSKFKDTLTNFSTKFTNFDKEIEDIKGFISKLESNVKPEEKKDITIKETNKFLEDLSNLCKIYTDTNNFDTNNFLKLCYISTNTKNEEAPFPIMLSLEQKYPILSDIAKYNAFLFKNTTKVKEIKNNIDEYCNSEERKNNIDEYFNSEKINNNISEEMISEINIRNKGLNDISELCSKLIIQINNLIKQTKNKKSSKTVANNSRITQPRSVPLPSQDRKGGEKHSI